MSQNFSQRHPSWDLIRKTLAGGGLGSWRAELDADGKILLALDDAFLSLVGLERSAAPDSLEQYLEDFIPPDQVGRVRELMTETLGGRREDFNCEHRLLIPGRDPVWVKAFGQAEKPEADGQNPSIFGFLQNITENKKNFDELAASKERLDTVMNGAKIGIWDWDVDSDRVTLSQVFSDLIGRPRSDMEGGIDKWYGLMHPDDRDLARATFEEAIAGGQNSYRLPFRLRHGLGHYTWVYEIGRVVERGPEGRATRLAGVHFDFNDRKQLEEEQSLALATIAEQKTAMEAQMGEKNRLLHQIQTRVSDIVKNSGAPAGRPGPDEGRQSEAALTTAEGTDIFADYLGRAFTFITDQMAWYKAILDCLPFPVGVFDHSGRWAYLNSPSRAVHGGHPLKDYLGRENRPELDNFVDYEIEGGDPGGETTTFSRYQTDLKRLFHGENSVLRDGQGRGIGRIEILRDVTEIREADERTRIMLDALPLACNFWDENFRNLDCNRAATTLFDLPDKQSYLDRFNELSPECQPNGRPSQELIREYVARAFHDGSCIFEWLHQKTDGAPIPCEVTLVRVARRDGYIVAGYTRDLREIKRTQAERDLERQTLRKIMDSAPIFFAITVDDVIKFITPFARNFSGRQIGDRLAEVFDNTELWAELKAELDKKRYVNWRSVDIRRSDGNVRSMLLNAFTTDYYGETGVMSWLMDITALQERAAKLQEARDAAEESTRAKSEFLANMSHEIRTPMNAILGLIHLVLQTEISDTQREYLQKTESSAKTLLRIINDILDFSKIEAGKLEMEQEEFHLADVVQQVADQVSTRAHEKGLEFLLNVPPDTPAGLIGDQVRLTQILTNLASNAVKFTEKGQVTLKVETLEEGPDQALLKFMVEDTGIGLSQDQIANIFAAFNQAEVSTTRRFGGTGLGLAISRRLVEMMGGDIWCQSQLGHGSTFCFTALFGLHNNNKRYIARRKDFTGLSALAVDDNVVGLEILSDFLKTLGFTVATASSGQEALDIITEWKGQGRRFDLIFIDWKMPDMDGIETSNRVHDLIAPAQLPVIIMATAYNRDEALGLARQSGIRNVMTKPLSPSTLLNVLVDIFGRGLPEKESKLKKAHEMAVVKELAGARILLAEDNEVNQLVASRILKNAGLVVEIAANGQEALDMVKARPYDLVLMDIQMPEMDGISATRAIRALPEFKDLPIVAMTAHAMSGDRELSLKAGMNDHINKPINLQELFSSLARWLRKKPTYN